MLVCWKFKVLIIAFYAHLFDTYIFDWLGKLFVWFGPFSHSKSNNVIGEFMRFSIFPLKKWTTMWENRTFVSLHEMNKFCFRKRKKELKENVKEIVDYSMVCIEFISNFVKQMGCYGPSTKHFSVVTIEKRAYTHRKIG